MTTIFMALIMRRHNMDINFLWAFQSQKRPRRPRAGFVRRRKRLKKLLLQSGLSLDDAGKNSRSFFSRILKKLYLAGNDILHGRDGSISTKPCIIVVLLRHHFHRPAIQSKGGETRIFGTKASKRCPSPCIQLS